MALLTIGSIFAAIFCVDFAVAYLNLAKSTDCGAQFIRLDVDEDASYNEPDAINDTLLEPPTRIAGGTVSFRGEFPAIVSLQVRTKTGSYQHICGGTVIDEQHILTAAHCVATEGLAEKMSIVFREFDLGLTETGRFGEERVWPTKIITHSKFDFKTFKHDIALIRFEPALQFEADPLVRPACLPEPPAKGNSILGSSFSYAHSPATVAGWGKISEGGPLSTVLQKVTVPILTNNACKTLLAGQLDINEGHLCAGWSRGGQSACQGDSGGPLFYREPDGHMTVIGIVSAGVGCARPLSPGVYTRVTKYIDWIRNNAAAEF